MTAVDLESAIASYLGEYRTSGTPLRASLDAFQPIQIRLERGRCYGAVARLADGAEFGEHARKGSVALTFDVAGVENTGGPGVVGPGVVFSGLCPQTTTTATLDLRATFGSAEDKSQIHELGKGAVSIQLYTHAITNKNLARRNKEEREQVAATKADVDARHAREAAAKDKVCSECKRDYDACIADWRRGASKQQCAREYNNCAHAHGAGVGTATWLFCGTQDPFVQGGGD